MQSYKERMLLAVLLALTSFAVAEEGDGASYYPTDAPILVFLKDAERQKVLISASFSLRKHRESTGRARIGALGAFEARAPGVQE